MGKPRLPDVEKQELLDLPMLLLTLLLTALGLVMIYSSSFARALYESGDSAFYFKRQLVFAALGIGAMLAISRVRPQLIRKLAFPVLAHHSQQVRWLHRIYRHPAGAAGTGRHL